MVMIDFNPGSLQTGLYQHYKGGRYEVLGFVDHAEGGQEMVIYRKYDPTNKNTRLFTRPVSHFTETVAMENSTLVPRFSKCA